MSNLLPPKYGSTLLVNPYVGGIEGGCVMSGIKKRILSLMSMVLILLTGVSVAQAAGLGFTYDGNYIIDKYSINSTSVADGATITVEHHQTRNYDANYNMTVYVVKKGTWGWTSIASRTFSQNASGTFTTSASVSGTYKLHFVSSAAVNGMGFKINGAFYR